MIDLHSHSTASDGTLNPSQLIDAACAAGLSALALTDHDTLDGLEQASQAAARKGLRFIPGIEIECSWTAPGVFHVLGLGFDPASPALATLITLIQAARVRRNSSMIERMAEHGIEADLDAVASFAAGQIVARPHFADYLVSIAKAKNRQDAFDRFLTPGKPFFAPYPGIDLASAVEVIHQAGGRISIAHPLSLYVSFNRLETLMQEWKAAGVDAVETWHPSASWKDAHRLADLAAKAGLKQSAGSDFHGDGRSDRVLGRSLAERHRIEERFLEAVDA